MAGLRRPIRASRRRSMVMTVPPCNFTGCPVRGSSGHERDIPEVWRLVEAAAADDPVRLVSVHALEAVRTMAQKPLGEAVLIVATGSRGPEGHGIGATRRRETPEWRQDGRGDADVRQAG